MSELKQVKPKRIQRKRIKGYKMSDGKQTRSAEMLKSSNLKLAAVTVALLCIFSSCAPAPVYQPNIIIVRVFEGDNAMDCAVYNGQFDCNWDDWN